MAKPAPIAVFAYDRAEILAETLTALAACAGFAGSRVHLYCDAPANEARSAAVAATCTVARTWATTHGARLVLRADNCGFRNITDALSELCATEGAVISLEDDHRPASGLLAFLDQGLARYADDERVFQVAGYRIGAEPGTLPPTFFLPLPMPIGWATWERAWHHFRWDIADGAAFLADPARRLAFDFGGAYPASRLLERTLAGSFNSYFIRWYAAMFLAGGLSLCARDSLVLNAGLASGVHGHGYVATERERFFNGAWSAATDAPLAWDFPAEVAVLPEVAAHIRAELRSRGA